MKKQSSWEQYEVDDPPKIEGRYTEYAKLGKENAELSNSVTELTNSKIELENKVTELKAQIKKMKNCANCRHFKNMVGCMKADKLNHRQCDIDNWESWECKT